MAGYAAEPSVAPTAEPGSAEQELAALKGLIARQTEARELLHRAVASQDPSRVSAAMRPEARELLLEVEVHWGQRELDGLSGAAALMKGLSAPTFLSEGELLAQEEERQQREGSSTEGMEEDQRAMREAQVERAWQEVQAAIDADDEPKLVSTLRRLKGVLPDERVAAAHRKIPGIRARAEMRKELTIALRNPDDLMTLKHVIFAAKRSCLPKAEIEEAECALKEAEAAKKKKKAVKSSDSLGETEESPLATAQPRAAVDCQAPPRETTKLTKEPKTKLELAVLAKDKELIQAAMAELRASGMSARDTSHQYARAMADFGNLG